MADVKRLYKYRSFEDPFQKNIIANSALYFSQIKHFNDPFDSRLSYRQEYTKSEIKKYWADFTSRIPTVGRLKDIKKKFGNIESFLKHANKIKNEQLNRAGILSLSTDPKSILMWSHYSNNHTGLIYEFEPMFKQSCFFNTLPPIKMDYMDEYEPLSFVATGEERKKQYERLLLTKHTDWKYEKEYRVIDLDYYGEKKYNKTELKSIIFGHKTEKDNILDTIELCENNGFEHVKFKKAEIVNGKFALETKDFKP